MKITKAVQQYMDAVAAKLNHQEIISRFHKHCKSLPAQEAIEATLQDCAEENLNNEELQVVAWQILLPEVVVLFSEKFVALENCCDMNESDESGEDDYLNKVFETFCAFEGIDVDLQNDIKSLIETATAYEFNADNINAYTPLDDEEEDETDEIDSDDDDIVIANFAKLTDKQRRERIAAFLRMLANAGNDNIRDMQPFITSLPDDDTPNPKMQNFDRKKAYANEDVRTPLAASLFLNEDTPNLKTEGWEEDHRTHQLHTIAGKHGFSFSHTVPVNHPNGSILHYHVWSNKQGHLLGSYAGDVKWRSKVSQSSGHTTEGIGTRALEKHLKNKDRRYKGQQTEQRSLPAVPIMETLLDQQSLDRVQRYADWMSKHPSKAFGVAGGTYDPPNMAQELKETAKLREAQNKRFEYGKDRSDWSLMDMRSGKPK